MFLAHCAALQLFPMARRASVPPRVLGVVAHVTHSTTSRPPPTRPARTTKPLRPARIADSKRGLTSPARNVSGPESSGPERPIWTDGPALPTPCGPYGVPLITATALTTGHCYILLPGRCSGRPGLAITAKRGALEANVYCLE